MVKLIIDNHAHRLLNNGQVESADIKDGQIDEKSWSLRMGGEGMNLSGGQMFTIHQLLSNINNMFPKTEQKPFVSPEEKAVYKPFAPARA